MQTVPGMLKPVGTGPALADVALLDKLVAMASCRGDNGRRMMMGPSPYRARAGSLTSRIEFAEGILANGQQIKCWRALRRAAYLGK